MAPGAQRWRQATAPREHAPPPSTDASRCRRSDGEEISAEEIDGELVELENEDIVTRAFEDVPAKKAGKKVNARQLEAKSALYLNKWINEPNMGAGRRWRMDVLNCDASQWTDGENAVDGRPWRAPRGVRNMQALFHTMIDWWVEADGQITPCMPTYKRTPYGQLATRLKNGHYFAIAEGSSAAARELNRKAYGAWADPDELVRLFGSRRGVAREVRARAWRSHPHPTSSMYFMPVSIARLYYVCCTGACGHVPGD